MTTIYEVSKLAGCSLSSVSRVMNKHEHVSEKTKLKVMDAMEKLNYRPNFTARSLASNCSNSVGVLVSEISGPFYSDLLSGVENELSAANKHAIIISGQGNLQKEKDAIEFLIDRNCDALILSVDSVSDEYLIKLCDGSIPVILINRYIAEIEQNCIYIDNELGGYMATKHLLDSGHSEVAYISGLLTKADARDRLSGYKKALKEFHITFDETLLYKADYTTKGGREGMLTLLENNPKLTAVVCANDEMASAAMRVAREKKINIPDDCSIIGFDNVYFSEYLYPQLTTIENPVNKMARMAVRWVLKNKYKQSKITIQNLFATELVLRESTQEHDNT